MGLLDGFVPQGFADRGGMLGRLLSLRPDIADHQDDAQAAQGQAMQRPGSQPMDISTSSPIFGVDGLKVVTDSDGQVITVIPGKGR
jgi:hypothetical protein